MRIHEISASLEPGAEAIVCHAPTGYCVIVVADGAVFHRAPTEDVRNLEPAHARLFEPHWRGANAMEIAAHDWDGPTIMSWVINPPLAADEANVVHTVSTDTLVMQAPAIDTINVPVQ